MPESFALPAKVRIVSGGQSCADIAGLDWALAHSVDHGGWCPKGRRSEDGPIAAHYVLRETPLSNYLQRTEWNVRDSDATVIFRHTTISLARVVRGLDQTRSYRSLRVSLTDKGASVDATRRGRPLQPGKPRQPLERS